MSFGSSSSLFAPAPAQPAPPSFAGFGQPATSAPAAQPGFPAFGQQPAQQQQPFGQPTQQQPGATLFGSVAQPATSAPALSWAAPLGQSSTANLPQLGTSQLQPTTATTFGRSTKFNDLPDQVRAEFEAIDNHIQGCLHLSNELGARALKDQPAKSAQPVRQVNHDAVGVVNMLHSDKTFIEDLKSKVDKAIQDVVFSTRVIDGFKNPAQSGAYLKSHAGFPLEFFTREALDLRERLQWCKSVIEQIERKLASSASQSPQAISGTMQAQHSTFVALAGRTAEIDAEVQRLKAAYTDLWKTRLGRGIDPFRGDAQ